MHQEIQAIRFDVEDIGKHVKSSKKRFSWTFGLNNRNHTLILDFSFISGKVKLVVDRKTMLESQLPANASFQHPFTLDGYAINILQQGQSFQLRINNKVFSHLYNQAKTNTQFKNYEDEIKDIKVNQNSFQNTQKTVKLNIGALDGAKKKTRQTAETQNWGNFGGSDLGIPSYFGESTSTQSQPQKKQPPKKQSLLDEEQEQTNQSTITTQTKPSIKATQQFDFFAQQKKQVISPLSPTKQQPANKEQFNTMQNMFATMNVSSSQSSQIKQDGSLDLLNSSSANLGQPVTASDYTTLQKLYATGAQNPMFPTPTLNQNVTPQNFNTMQNLFATGVPNQGLTGITLQQPVGISQVGSLNPPATGASDFYTIGNLFATGAQNQGVNLTGSINPPKADNFNTMQNLFATTNQPPQNFNGINQPVPDIQNFNTMQNLFATGSGIMLPPPTQPAPVKSSNDEDPFSVLGLSIQTTKKPQTKPTASVIVNQPNAAMFNTYSGSKTSSTLDASSFGTMQKGQGNIDFFQSLSQPQPTQQQVPNFSKKKQAAEDLI